MTDFSEGEARTELRRILRTYPMTAEARRSLKRCMEAYRIATIRRVVVETLVTGADKTASVLGYSVETEVTAPALLLSLDVRDYPDIRLPVRPNSEDIKVKLRLYLHQPEEILRSNLDAALKAAAAQRKLLRAIPIGRKEVEVLNFWLGEYQLATVDRVMQEARANAVYFGSMPHLVDDEHQVVPTVEAANDPASS